MKKSLFIVLTFLILGCKSDNSLSQVRYDVPGSRATISIPENAEVSPHYSAITVENEFEMSIIEFHGDMESKMKEVDSAGLAQRGMKIYSEFSFVVDAYNGKIIHGYSNPEADVVQLLFGDSTFYVFASTLYTKGDEKLFNQILKYYKSIEINKNKRIDWDDFIAIKYDKNNAFQLPSEIIAPFSLIFARNPKKMDKTSSTIHLQQFPNLGMFKDLDHFTGQMLSSTIFPLYEKLDEIVKEEKVLINGKKAYDFQAYFIDENSERHFVRCLARLNEEVGVTILAIAKNNEDKKDINSFFDYVEFKN